MATAISVEETNKIRKSLGLPLLAVPGAGPTFKEPSSDSDSDEEKGSTLESRQAQAYDNYRRVEDERKTKAARDNRKKAIQKERDLAARNVKLEGKGLGEEDDQEQDTRAWLMSQKKRQKKIDKERERTRRMEEELKARENISYTSKDLAGVRVAHELGDFEEEDEHILVLKDANVDDNDEEGDELENVNLREQERRNDRLELKKKKPAYNPNDAEEDGENGILKQYDEVIDGKKRKRFTLDTDGQTVEQKESAKSTVGEQTKKQAISLDLFKDMPQSDYAEPKEVKVRKPKKQKTKSTRKKTVDEDDIFPTVTDEQADGGHSAGAMEVDGGDVSSRLQVKASSFIDDDDLQNSLARQRREALKRRKKNRPEDLARQVRDEEENAMQEDNEGDNEGLVIDETSFFVSNIDERQREIEEERDAEAERQTRQVDKSGGEEDEMVMEDTGDVEPSMVKQEESPPPEEPAPNGLADETDFNQGLGGVFNFIKGRGMWEAHESSDANDNTRKSQVFRSEKRRIETESEAKARAQRLAGREAGRYAGHSQREREEMHRKENEMRQQQDSHKMARLFADNYKPNFELSYKDEFGREMNSKEAFKHLSHQFHGKGSGKMKTEKHLKKIEDEKKNEAKSLMDNSQMSNYSNAADATAKRRGTVGVQLGK